MHCWVKQFGRSKSVGEFHLGLGRQGLRLRKWWASLDAKRFCRCAMLFFATCVSCSVFKIPAIVATLGSPAMADEIIVGRAMGMMYRLDFGEPVAAELRLECGDLIASELSRIESIFSLYRSDSELSRWNAVKGLEPIKVGDDVVKLVLQARLLWQASDGAFDPTIYPLMKVWGFNSSSVEWNPPMPDRIESALQLVGMEQIELDADNQTLRKLQAGVELDLNALVEGWAIDRIVVVLREKKLRNFLFQLGGEYYADGHHQEGEAWTIGIEDPTNPNRLAGKIELSNQALSVSGNYRSGRTNEGKWYSHLLDPRTGYPSREKPSLVAVTADRAFEADGWATTLMMVSRDRAIELANDKSLAAWFVDSANGESTAIGSVAGKDIFVAIRTTPESSPGKGFRFLYSIPGSSLWH